MIDTDPLRRAFFRLEQIHLALHLLYRKGRHPDEWRWDWTIWYSCVLASFAGAGGAEFSVLEWGIELITRRP